MLFLGSEWGEPRNLGTLKSLGLVVGGWCWTRMDLRDGPGGNLCGSLESFRRTWNLRIILVIP